ncbi:TIGR03619 family F420-dependent LLM class oxidoreductase [Streptomyces sp. XM4011]|uniref:TIGR03619 family F420-dependent LLM class oxidoreductase n=1 Tax=Streptomyces TaxID=1883 RepID=UPI001FFC087A|nr:TIGR03619 family F420-dependent LLM class oxidoreductase [Streptomyces sp. XM4011]MCK1815298.1 TIGR03619 family F420-dependent LLM class oxidoreductase [Streptomyces sp. XM4011]
MTPTPVLEAVLPSERADADPRALAALARQAEDLGYAAVWLPDHLLPPGPYGPVYGGVHEPLVTLGYLAAVTHRIRLGTSVLVLPMRSPFVVAKQAATLQQLSAGRLVLGVGIGWDRAEFAAVGADFERRAARTDEALRLLRHLTEGGDGPFEGEFHGYERGVFAPHPAPRLHLMTGGTSAPALRRAARYADSWQAFALTPPEFADRAARLRELAGARRVAAGTRIAWTDARTTAAEARAFGAAGAAAVAVHFGPDDGGYGERMTALAREWSAGS